jgi:tetratricopeptide (TPR) repeat protein
MIKTTPTTPRMTLNNGVKLPALGRLVFQSSHRPDKGRPYISAGSAVLHVVVASLMLTGTLWASELAEDWVRQLEFGNALVETGDLDQAHRVYTEALHNAQTDPSVDHIRVSLVLQNMGRLFDRRGQLREAETAYLRGITALNKAGVADDRVVVRAYVGLPAVYIQTGQYSKAETLIRRVLTDYPSSEESDKASLMGTLGVILAHKHKFAEAEQVLQTTAELCAGSPSSEMQEVGAIAVANLGGLHMRNGRVSDAIDSYRHAVALMEALPAPSPTTLTVTLADYANAVRSTGDVQATENLYRKAIAVAEARLGHGNVIVAELFNQYAEVLRDDGKKSEARKLDNAARRIRSEWNRVNMTGHTIEFESLLGRR